MKKLRECVLFAIEKHKGQKRNYSDTDFVVHSIRVMTQMDTFEEKIVAVLHDVVEDTDATIQDIRFLAGDAISDKVDILTHKNGTSYIEYIKEVSVDEICTKVKIADIVDNLSDNPSSRMIEKGIKAIYYLTETTHNTN